MERQVKYKPYKEIDFRDQGFSNLSIHFNLEDTIFGLTINKSIFEGREKMTNMIGKMIVVNDYSEINLSNLTHILGNMNIDRLFIFSINLTDKIQLEKFVFNGESNIIYLEIGVKKFIDFIGENPKEFWNINKNALYILRDGNYTDVKYILSQIGEFGLNLGRGGSQKSHVMSPLEIRLSSYIMAMFNFDYTAISSSNAFNSLSKSRYLPYIENKRGNKNKELIVDNN